MAAQGPNVLPTVTVYVNRDSDRVLEWYAGGTWDWNDWDNVLFVVPAISLSMDITTNNRLQVLSVSDLKMKFRTADYGAMTAGTYRYQVLVAHTGDGITQPAPMGEGVFHLLPAVA